MGDTGLFLDPRKPLADLGGAGFTLQIAAPLPERVPVGHYDARHGKVVDEEIPRAEYLERIQQACRDHRDAYLVRFYDHFDVTFDAAVLEGLDEVQRLMIDTCGSIRTPEAVARLPRLKSLTLAARGNPPADLLHRMGVQRLVQFTLAGTSKPLLDLAPLGEAADLRSLRLLGQGKRIEAVAKCDALVELSMQPTEKTPLEFVNDLAQLEVLKLSVGKRRNLDAIGFLPALRDLSLNWVHTLDDLGDLQRFPRLRRLQTEMQKRLKRIVVGPGNRCLEHINVDGVEVIEGFDDLPALISYHNFAGDFAPAWDRLPPTLTHYAVPPAALAKREKHFAEVRAQGLVPEPHPDSQFFYK